MDIKQKASDITLLVKNERKYQIFAVLGVLAIGFLLFSGPKQRPAAKLRNDGKHEQATERSRNLANRESSGDLMNAFRSEVDQTKKEVADIKTAVTDTNKKIDDFEAKTSEIFKEILTRMQDENAAGGGPGGPGSDANASLAPAPVDIMDASAMAPDAQPDALESFGNDITKEVPPPPPADPRKIALIGAGDSVSVKLLAGVRAPTDGTPYPVLFKLIGDIQGPDGSSLPIGEARLIGAAQGSLTDSRVLFRLTKLSMRLPNGRRKVMNVDGWVVGEDGIRGMQGIPWDPIGKAIGAAGMIGGLGAASEGLARSVTKITRDAFGGQIESIQTGDLGIYSAGKAGAGFANQWGEIVAERVRDLVPHVEVYSGREGTAIFSNSVAIKDLYESLETEEDVFPTLD